MEEASSEQIGCSFALPLFLSSVKNKALRH